MAKLNFVGKDQQLEQIRAFCQRSTDSGGVLLVSGSRGLGKTRLVDAALNERAIKKKPGIINQLFGNVSDSQRHTVIREPNHVNRYLIKVDVDPYFPYSCADTAKTPSQEADNKTQIEPDETALSIALIRNIIFALTSVIDCHYSPCKHGKTMREKLGFWNYWFSTNALRWRAGQWNSLLVLFVSWLMLYSGLATFHCFFPETAAGYLPALGISILVPLLVWVWLRWKDWQSLGQLSKKLFALVHAESSQETKDSIEQTKQNNLWIPVLFFILLIIALCFSFVGDISLDSLGKLLKKIPNPLQFLMGGSLTAAGFLWVSSQRSQQHIEFGGNNPVWMITLLKRYLYLCHRCGIEPVLVFDELDKLEDMDEWWSQRVKQTNLTSENQELLSRQSKQPPKLDEFLLTLARLKASLGTEFLWVLIGGPNVYSRLRQDRHNRSDGALGLLATTIQQEVLVEPISYDDTKQLFEDDTNESSETPVSTVVEEKKIKTLWLRSYANLSTIIRNHEKLHYTHHNKTEILANKLIEIWSTDMQLDYIHFTSDDMWLDKIKEEWVQNWIHSGMLIFANELLKKPISYRMMREQIYEHWPVDSLGEASDIVIHPEIVILQSEDARLLMALGKQILFSFLSAEGHLSNPQDNETKREYVQFQYSSAE